jgi:BMFP domain-containing protein YqiC
MTERSKFFDDLAGVAGGAMSALAGLRDEAESTIRARVEEVIRKLDLVRREDLEAVQEMAANARAAQAALEVRVAALEARLGGAASVGPAAVDPAPPVANEEARPDTPEPSAPKSAE